MQGRALDSSTAGVDKEKKIEISSSGARVLHVTSNLIISGRWHDELTRRVRQSNVSQCKMHVQGLQSYCFC